MSLFAGVGTIIQGVVHECRGCSSISSATARGDLPGPSRLMGGLCLSALLVFTTTGYYEASFDINLLAVLDIYSA